MTDTSKTAKIIKRRYYSAAHWQLDDVIVSDIIFLWFVLLCKLIAIDISLSHQVACIAYFVTYDYDYIGYFAKNIHNRWPTVSDINTLKHFALHDKSLS